MTPTTLIAGGGIGGLACALALARAGVRSAVLEQSSALAEVGAGRWTLEDVRAALEPHADVRTDVHGSVIANVRPDAADGEAQVLRATTTTTATTRTTTTATMTTGTITITLTTVMT